MIRQISCSLLVLLLFASCENRYRKGRSHTNATASVDSKYVGKTSDDAYQVSASEYDNNFVSRYGLLYLKASNDPFTGRILTVEMGESGEFVSSDESWKQGKKHGKSSKWFSNGIKMYERNYNEGRWHGSVTRWWPNGQKMYVRAYTNGVRHGNEATWRSDGTPLSLPAGKPASIQSQSESVDALDSLPGGDIDNTPIFPTIDSEPVIEEAEFGEPLITEDSDRLVVPEPDSQAEQSTEAFTDLPTFPPMEEGETDTSSEIPEFPSSEGSNPIIPPPTSDEVNPVPLPEDSPDGLPVLPGLDEVDGQTESDPILLPGLPDESDSGGLPLLPGMEEEGDSGLPPLPSGGDDGLGELPPLPPLP